MIFEVGEKVKILDDLSSPMEGADEGYNEHCGRICTIAEKVFSHYKNDPLERRYRLKEIPGLTFPQNCLVPEWYSQDFPFESDEEMWAWSNDNDKDDGAEIMGMECISNFYDWVTMDIKVNILVSKKINEEIAEALSPAFLCEVSIGNTKVGTEKIFQHSYWMDLWRILKKYYKEYKGKYEK